METAEAGVCAFSWAWIQLPVATLLHNLATEFSCVPSVGRFHGVVYQALATQEECCQYSWDIWLPSRNCGLLGMVSGELCWSCTLLEQLEWCGTRLNESFPFLSGRLDTHWGPSSGTAWACALTVENLIARPHKRIALSLLSLHGVPGSFRIWPR